MTYIPAAKAADLLRCDSRTIRRYCESGELTGVQRKARGWWLVDRESVQRMLDKLDKPDSHMTALER